MFGNFGSSSLVTLLFSTSPLERFLEILEIIFPVIYLPLCITEITTKACATQLLKAKGLKEGMADIL